MSEVNEKKGKGNVEQKMRSKEGREIKKEEKEKNESRTTNASMQIKYVSTTTA